MNISRLGWSGLMMLSFAMAGSASAQEPASADNPFEIKSVQRVVKAMALVGNSWKNSVPCIQAEIRVIRDLGEGKPYAKAYFFDKDGTQLMKYDTPPQVTDDHRTYTGMPTFFKPKQEQKVAFPITERATQTGAKWARVIVVFGDSKFAVAECYPKDDLTKFAFPEKELAAKSAKAH